MDHLKLYQIDMKYVRDLHNADDRVESVSPQIGKANINSLLKIHTDQSDFTFHPSPSALFRSASFFFISLASCQK